MKRVHSGLGDNMANIFSIRSVQLTALSSWLGAGCERISGIEAISKVLSMRNLRLPKQLANQVAVLGKRGPHEVQVGDLSVTGLPGKVYTPKSGKGLPGVVFAHDWRLGTEAYRDTLVHLASWGIAVVAPDTETSFNANTAGLAADLETSLQVLAGVRLGSGDITVDPGQLYLVGHGMGAAAAVDAASRREYLPAGVRDKVALQRPRIAGVVAIYPADAEVEPITRAGLVKAPGLVLDAGALSEIPRGDALSLAGAWLGDVVYRKVESATGDGFSETGLKGMLFGRGMPEFAARELVRALTTGFVLAGTHDRLEAFRTVEAKIAGTEALSAQKASEAAVRASDPKTFDYKALLRGLRGK